MCVLFKKKIARFSHLKKDYFIFIFSVSHWNRPVGLLAVEGADQSRPIQIVRQLGRIQINLKIKKILNGLTFYY